MKILETMIEKSIDKKLLRFQNNPVTPEKTTYADIAKDNLRRRNEQVTREREKCLRKNNAVIHLMKHLRLVHITPSIVTRIGVSGNGKNRPMKISFVSAWDKDRFMNELKLLKGNIEYTGISITADYTREERLLIKELRLYLEGSRYTRYGSRNKMYQEENRLCKHHSGESGKQWSTKDIEILDIYWTGTACLCK